MLKESKSTEVSRGHSILTIIVRRRPEFSKQGSELKVSKKNKLSKECRYGIQVDLFAKKQDSGIKKRGGTSRKEQKIALISRLEEQRTLTSNTVDKISDQLHLLQAFRRVKSNNGTAGIDGITVEKYERDLLANIKQLQIELKTVTYEPNAVRGVEIEKPNGGTRLLGIPTVADRLVQQSIQTELQMVFDPFFSENSFGFRPGRSAHQAIERASECVKEGKIWVVDIDLKSFFDEINHDRLMNRLRNSISDKKLLKLIHQFLRAGLMQGGVETQRIAGTPQGGPLSPLLSNIVLDELDKELEVRGLSFVRYADDCNIFVGSERSAHRVLESITMYIEKKLKLKVNKEKSGVRRCDKVKFLGHTIMGDGKIRIADKSILRFKVKIREVTKRNRAIPLRRLIKELNLIIQGWAIYYRKCNTWLSSLREMDGWIRNRLRCYALKQHGRKYATYRFLKSLGLAEGQSWNAVRFYGWWPMANLPYVRKGMGLAWFAGIGLRSLVAVQKG